MAEDAAAPFAATIRARIQEALRETLLLEQEERALLSTSAERRALAGLCLRAATNYRRAADDLADPSQAAPALLLYLEAARHLVRALVLLRDPEADPATLSAPRAARMLVEHAGDGAQPALPANVEKVCLALADEPSPAVDPSDEHCRVDRDVAASAVTWLSSFVDVRTPGEIRSARAARVAVGAGVVVGALGWLVAVLVAPRDIALHKPVTLSGRHPSATCPPDGTGLVNGVIEPDYGFHTATGSAAAPAWGMVDLQRLYAITKVEVYNRGDGWFDEGLPMTVETSEDGTSFSEIGVCAVHFTATTPCVLTVPAKRGRFVRIRSNYQVALSELKVFGAKK